MDKLMQKVESSIDKIFDNFQEKPIKTSIVALVIYWILKSIYKDVRNN